MEVVNFKAEKLYKDKQNHYLARSNRQTIEKCMKQSLTERLWKI
ncbi:hypothetical protein STRDD04_00416 [Streptococcus sp. DD04]|nr:hypothetical protein STRDD04_00416 [Streptococcus sp. DD04]